MEVGDLVQIKSTAFYTADYHWLLLNEKMLVTEVVCQSTGKIVETVSESGTNRFPMSDVEVIHENR